MRAILIGTAGQKICSSSNRTPPHAYDTLPSGGAIRLMGFRYDENDDTIVYSLVVKSLDPIASPTPKYYVVFYAWGDPKRLFRSYAMVRDFRSQGNFMQYFVSPAMNRKRRPACQSTFGLVVYVSTKWTMWRRLSK